MKVNAEKLRLASRNCQSRQSAERACTSTTSSQPLIQGTGQRPNITASSGERTYPGAYVVRPVRAGACRRFGTADRLGRARELVALSAQLVVYQFWFRRSQE